MKCAYLVHAMPLQPSFHPRQEIFHQSQLHQKRGVLRAERESRHDHQYTRRRHLRLHDNCMVAAWERRNPVATEH